MRIAAAVINLGAGLLMLAGRDDLALSAVVLALALALLCMNFPERQA